MYGVSKQASKQASKLQNCSLQNESHYRCCSCATRNCFLAVVCRPTLHRKSSDKTKFMTWIFYHVPFCDSRAISFTKCRKFNFIFHFDSAYGSETQITPPYLRAKFHSIISDIYSVFSDKTLSEGHISFYIIYFHSVDPYMITKSIWIWK